MVGHAVKIVEAIKRLNQEGWLAPAPPYVSLYTPEWLSQGGSAESRGYPVSPGEVTLEFLTSLMGTPIDSFTIDTSMMDAGVLADAFMVNLVYAESTSRVDTEFDNPIVQDGKTLPDRIFLKVTKAAQEIADLSTTVGFVYEKEVYFYESLYKQIGSIRVPKSYGVFKDESDPHCKTFCLVMECLDTENEWRSFDQFRTTENAAPMTPDEFEAFVAFLAGKSCKCSAFSCGCTFRCPGPLI